MKPALQLKLSQHLALTPQLQQSIRLLQLSTLELEQELEKYLLENPLIEREEEEYAPTVPVAGTAEAESASKEQAEAEPCEQGAKGAGCPRGKAAAATEREKMRRVGQEEGQAGAFGHGLIRP